MSPGSCSKTESCTLAFPGCTSSGKLMYKSLVKWIKVVSKPVLLHFLNNNKSNHIIEFHQCKLEVSLPKSSFLFDLLPCSHLVSIGNIL